MEILFLGTGAADWETDPPNVSGIRRMSSVLVDNSILIDVAPSSYKFFKFLGYDAGSITDIFLTHSHSDHLCFDDLTKFAASSGTIRFWCHEDVKKRLTGRELPGIEICDVFPFGEIKINGFKIMPLPANHLETEGEEIAFHYIFEKDGKKMFYGCDGGWFLSKTWEYLRSQVLDCAILDCTGGDFVDEMRLCTHNSIPMVRMIIEAMHECGILKRNSKPVVSHLAKTLHCGIDETAQLLAKDGITMAYDGLKLSV